MIPEQQIMRQMTPILPNEEQFRQNHVQSMSHQDMSSDTSCDMLLEQQIRQAQYDPMPQQPSMTSAREKRALQESMSPSVLDADFAELQARRMIGNGITAEDGLEILSGERSHMYETGGQSDAIRSIKSKTCQTPPKEKNATQETSDAENLQLNQPSNTDQQQITSTKINTSSKNVGNKSYQNILNSSQITTPLLKDKSHHDQKRQQEKLKVDQTRALTEQSQSQMLGSSALDEVQERVEIKSDSPERPRTTQQLGDVAAAPMGNSRQDDVKLQISLKYDQIELERKLAEMCSFIGDFQKAYDHKDPSSRAATAMSQRSQKSAGRSSTDQSRSPPRQIQQRNVGGNGRTKKPQNVIADQASSMSEAELTMVNSECESSALIIDEEQTFRPKGVRRGHHDMPLQQRETTNKRAINQPQPNLNLVKEKGFYEQRAEQREQEYKDVMDKRDKQPYNEYVKELEERSRENLCKARNQNGQVGHDKRHAHFSQPPPSRPQRSPTQEREESFVPKPEARPKLPIHESCTIDGRYFTAMSKATLSQATDSAALFSSRSRPEQTSNLISCLRSGRQHKNVQGSSGHNTDTFFSPREGTRGGKKVVPGQSSNKTAMMIKSHQPRPRLRRPHSYTLGPDTLESSGIRSDKASNHQNFKEIMSPSSISNRQDPQQSSPRISMGRLLRDTIGQQCHETSVNRFEQQHHQHLTNTLLENLRQRVRQEDGEPDGIIYEGEESRTSRAMRNIRNIDGFEVVQQIQQQMLSQSRQGAPLSTTDRQIAVNDNGTFQKSQNQLGPLHSTHRSMGIESYCQNKEYQKQKPPQPQKQKRQAAVADSESPVTMFPSAIEQIQSKSEKLCQQLTQARRNRKEIEDNKNELLALKGENHNLKKAIEQKDLALCSLREQNGEQKRVIDELQQQNAHLETEVETVGDQELFRKYKELQRQKEEVEQKMAQTQFTYNSNQKSYDLMKQSYEQLKQGQLELVEMNKKLIVDHQEETQRLTEELAIVSEKLEVKSKKLDRYIAVTKTFDAQIEMFDQFQQKSLSEMKMLQSQVTLFQDLFQKEKQEKEECIARMRPSQRPLHDSVKKQLLQAQQQQQQSQGQHTQLDSNRDWEAKVNAFESSNKYPSLATDQNLLSYREHQQNQHQQKDSGIPGLTQTMSKNLSFGQPFRHGDSYNFRSGQSSNKREDNFGSGVGSARVNPHLVNLPGQILNENFSDTDKNNEVVKYDNRSSIRGDSNECTSNFARQYNQNNGAVNRPHKQDSSVGGRPHSGARAIDDIDNSYIESNYENGTSMIHNYQTPSEAPTVKDRWNSRHRSNSYNGHHYRMAEYHHQIGNRVNHNNPNISSDIIENRNQDAFQIRDDGHHSQDGRRTLQPYRGVTAMSEADKVAQSALNNSRKVLQMQQQHSGTLLLEDQKYGNKMDQPNNFTPSQQQSQSKTKMKPMSPKDYYCRLKEMQKRLDRARNDIQLNVIRSRSRSKSPAATGKNALSSHRSNTGEQQQPRRQTSHFIHQEYQPLQQHQYHQQETFATMPDDAIDQQEQEQVENQGNDNIVAAYQTSPAGAIVNTSAVSIGQHQQQVPHSQQAQQQTDVSTYNKMGGNSIETNHNNMSSLLITNMSQMSAGGTNHPYQTVNNTQPPKRPVSSTSTRGKSWEQHRRDFPRPQQSKPHHQNYHAKRKNSSLIHAAAKGGTHISGNGQVIQHIQPPHCSTPVPTTNAKNQPQALFYTSLYNGVQPLNTTSASNKQ